jgi:hypothetical protein
MNRVYKLKKICKRAETTKLLCNLDLLEPEKLCWEVKLTCFHRKPVIRVYEMIKVKRKCYRSKLYA